MSVNFKRPRWAWFAASLSSTTLLLCITAASVASAEDMANATTPSTEATSSTAPPLARHGSVFVDPLGFLLFGPTAGVELGSNHLGVSLYGRWFNEGLLAHQLFLNAGDSFAFSYGVGLRARYFLGSDLAGPHLGAGLELIRARVDNSAALVSTKSTYVVPLLEGGYRLPFSGAYVGASAAFGYAIEASSGVDNLPGGQSASQYVPTDRSTVYGTAALELGIYF